MQSAAMSHFRMITAKLFSSRYLFATNVTSFGLLMGAGDIGVQQFVRLQQPEPMRSNTKHDWARTARLATVGLMLGPFNHAWYGLLDKLLPSVRLGVVSQKILLDQIIASPFFAFTFLMGAGLMERKRVEDCWVEFRGKFWQVYKADWTVWPAAQAVNFLFLPPRFRVIYVGAVMLFWDSFLSYVKHQEEANKDSMKSIPSPSSAQQASSTTRSIR